MFSRLTWTERIQAALGLAMVCLLIFATNRLDNRHFERVQGTLTSIFKDRVVAQDLILDLSREFHTKELRLATDSEEWPAPEDQRIETLLGRYEATKLTREEHELFQRLKTNVAKVSRLEASAPSETTAQELDTALAAAIEDLNKLAKLQVDESRRLTRDAQLSLDSTQLHSKIEIATLVILGLFMQILILVKPWE